MQNRAIEIHDSAVDSIAIENGVAVIHFVSAYIHQSDGIPGVDAGTGWTQEALLRIGHGAIEGAFSEEVRKALGNDRPHYLYDGSLRVGDKVLDNVIPIPLDVLADVELTLESCGYTVRVKGTSARLELVGEAVYVEEFKP